MPSPNPRGRPKGPATLAAALREAFPVQRLVKIAEEMMLSSNEDVRFKTLLQILDRCHGKVADKLELGPPGSLDEESDPADGYTLDELRAMKAIEEARAARRALENRDQNPKVLDGGSVLSPTTVALVVAIPDEE
jgi:hypothetical protein